MSIPVKLSEQVFKKYIEPHLTKAKRGYVCKIPLYKIFNYILYVLYTGCQWQSLPIENKQNNQLGKEISYQAVYHHFRKWTQDGSLKKVFEAIIKTIRESLNLSEINFDGSHTISKKGGESVAYQGRKKAKTSNILPVTDKEGHIIGTTQIISGNHHDSFELKEKLQEIFKHLKRLSLNIEGAYFNSDSAFDSKGGRKVCWNHGVIPNIDENQLNTRGVKRGRKRHFNKEVYNNRFCIERSFACVDKFKRLLIRFERKDIYFLGFHFIAFTMINLRNLIC